MAIYFGARVGRVQSLELKTSEKASKKRENSCLNCTVMEGELHPKTIGSEKVLIGAKAPFHTNLTVVCVCVDRYF